MAEKLQHCHQGSSSCEFLLSPMINKRTTFAFTLALHLETTDKEGLKVSRSLDLSGLCPQGTSRTIAEFANAIEDLLWVQLGKLSLALLLLAWEGLSMVCCKTNFNHGHVVMPDLKAFKLDIFDRLRPHEKVA